MADGAVSSRRGPVEGRQNRLLAFFGRPAVLPLVLITPVLLFFIIWNTIPTLWLLGLSFYRFSLTSGRPPIFSGWYNYTSIFNDAATWLALSRTFIFVVLAVGIETVAGFFLGLLFWRSDSSRAVAWRSRCCSRRWSSHRSPRARSGG